MPFLSESRNRVFVPLEKRALQVGDFPDFYAILNVENSARPHDLEEAIFSRGADLLAASFSRGAKSELLDLLDKYQTVFRKILLEPQARRAYDELLSHHKNGEPDAPEIAQFLEKWAPAPTKKRRWFGG